jgi:hypothetical protein
MHVFLILQSKIKKTGIHSLFSFAAAGGESLFRQPPGCSPALYSKRDNALRRLF